MTTQRTDTRRAEDRLRCSTHEDMVSILTTLTTNLKWHTRIGYGVFSVGLAVLTLCIYTVFYAGSLNQRVIANSKALAANDLRIAGSYTYTENKVNRHVDVYHTKASH